MEIKVSEVMQREDNSLYLKEIEMINYEKGEILNTPDNVVKLMTDVFEINKKISEEIFVIALTTDSKPLHFFKLNRGTVNTSLFDTRGLMISLLLANASTFVIVPNVLPCTITLAPIIGSPFSSTTRPDIFLLFALLGCCSESVTFSFK